MTTKAPVKQLALSDQFKGAIQFIEGVLGIKKITTMEQYRDADAKYKVLIQHEKTLDIQYNELQCVIDAKIAQAQKLDLAARLKAAKKYIKDSPMKAFDDEQERIRLAEEEKQRKILQDAQDKENARLQKIADEKKAAADKEAARLAAIAAKAKGKADKEKAAQDLKDAKKRQDEADKEAERVKLETANAPEVTVVVEKSHQGVSRRKIFKWRVTTKTGKQFSKATMKDSDRIPAAEFNGLPASLFVLDPVLLSAYVDRNGMDAVLAGVLEVKEELV